jgi:hypothetical protein
MQQQGLGGVVVWHTVSCWLVSLLKKLGRLLQALKNVATHFLYHVYCKG